MKFKRIICFAAVLTVLLTGACGRKTEVPETTTEKTTTGLPGEKADNEIYQDPVDFAGYMAVNREVYAYIRVPGTNIDYPVVQSGISDNYYLRRTWEDKPDYRGSIFTQSANAREFTDPVTVVYGHNTDKGDMFSELLYFTDSGFFDKHDIFYIFIPGHILVYRIFSAHTFDDRHILNSYDFSSPEVLEEFQQTLLNPPVLEKNVREGTELNETSEIVTLSTCAEPRSGGTVRYFVNGVLVNDVDTAEVY